MNYFCEHCLIKLKARGIYVNFMSAETLMTNLLSLAFKTSELSMFKQTVREVLKDRQADRQINSHKYSQNDRQTDIQIDKQTYR